MLGAFVFVQCSGSDKYNPDTSLSAAEKDKLKMTIIRYVARLLKT